MNPDELNPEICKLEPLPTFRLGGLAVAAFYGLAVGAIIERNRCIRAQRTEKLEDQMWELRERIGRMEMKA